MKKKNGTDMKMSGTNSFIAQCKQMKILPLQTPPTFPPLNPSTTNTNGKKHNIKSKQPKINKPIHKDVIRVARETQKGDIINLHEHPAYPNITQELYTSCDLTPISFI